MNKQYKNTNHDSYIHNCFGADSIIIVKVIWIMYRFPVYSRDTVNITQQPCDRSSREVEQRDKNGKIHITIFKVVYLIKKDVIDKTEQWGNAMNSQVAE